MLFTFILTVSSVYADNNNTYNSNQTYNVKGVVNYNRGTVDNSEQYKLTINKDEHTDNVHVEILPDSNNEYWIPKNYNVRVTGDYASGYISNSGEGIYTMNVAKNINLTSSAGINPTTAELLERIEQLEQKVSTNEADYTLKNKQITNKVGNTDISIVGSTVTGAIANLNPVILYSDSTGIYTGNVLLSDDANNYQYLSIEVNGKRIIDKFAVEPTMNFIFNSGYAAQYPNAWDVMATYYTVKAEVNGTSITFSENKNSRIGHAANGTWWYDGSYNAFTITKIIGYKIT